MAIPIVGDSNKIKSCCGLHVELPADEPDKFYLLNPWAGPGHLQFTTWAEMKDSN